MGTEQNATSYYGVSEQCVVASDLDRAAEEVACLGYSVIGSGYSAAEQNEFGCAFDAAHRNYVDQHGETFLREIDEYNGIRLPLALDAKFLDLAMNERVLNLVRKLIRNEFILNQQNGIINPAGQTYNQGVWHRDLPYQHFVTSRPLAINALFCVDDFTIHNGATFVLPCSHKQEVFPSDVFIDRNQKQIVAPAGSFIVMDCMVFHRGGTNHTSSGRRAVNQVYTTAFIKQQIGLPTALAGRLDLSADAARLLGFKYQMPGTVADYLKSRRR